MTKRRIRRIGPIQAGKMLGMFYGCMGLIALPFFLIFALAGAFASSGSGHQAAGGAVPLVAGSMFMIFIGLAIPIFYGFMGFIFGIIGAGIYNLLASWIGGIEVEVEEA